MVLPVSSVRCWRIGRLASCDARRSSGYCNPAILGELRRFAPTYVIVYGYNQLTHWLTFGYCARQGSPSHCAATRTT